MKKTCILMILFIILTTGCSNRDNNISNNKEISTKEYNYFVETCINANQKVVFNMFNQNIGIYDLNEKKWEPVYGQDNIYSYGLDGDNSIFSIGSSLYNKFSIVLYDKTVPELISIKDIPEEDSIIPIGYYNENYYFIYNKDDLGDLETRKIVFLQDDELVEVLDLQEQMITNGVIINDSLYYTVYDDIEDIYVLNCYDLISKKEDTIKNIDTEYIFNCNNEIVYVNQDYNLVTLEGDIITTVREDAEYELNSKYNILIQVYVNSSGNLIGNIIDLNKNKSLIDAEYFYGYAVEDNIIYLYCEGDIKKVSLD